MQELINAATNSQGVIGSNGISIKDYFLKIHELQKSGEQYPVDLDELWTLCYSRRDKAIRALTDNYIQDEDYKLAPHFGEARYGGQNKKIYKLTTACMEHFIARKVKEVFEVYRQVFHKVVETPQLSTIDLIIQSAQAIKEQEQRTTVLENKVLLLEAKTTTTPDYFTVVGYAIGSKVKIGLQMAAKIGAKAKAICKQEGIPVESIPDPRFGKVGMYPRSVLEQAFQSVQF